MSAEHGLADAASALRADCRACGATDLFLAVDLGPMPLAGAFRLPDDPSPELRLPLRAWFCRACSLLQVRDVVDPRILFADYRYVSSVIPPLARHFADYAAVLAGLVPPGGLVVEVGANDGVLLAPLAARGVRAVGVDLSENVSAMARAKGLDVRTGAFDRGAAQRLRDELGEASIVTGSNVFAHIDDVHEVVEAALRLLADDGLFVVEVHHAGALLDGLQYETLYHEHLCEWSATSLSRLFQRHEMELVRVERLPMHGGALRAWAARAGRRDVEPSVAALQDDERRAGIDDEDVWRRFGRDAAAHQAGLRALLQERRAAGRRVAGYGAAGRATILLNAAGVDRSLLDVVYDASPLRAGRLVPGTRIPVVSPDEMKARPPDVLIVLAWNYLDEILGKERWFQQQGGEVIVPLPVLRVLPSVLP